MIKKGVFKKPNNILEGAQENSAIPQVPDKIMTSCPVCKAMLISETLDSNAFICPKCGHHFRIKARRRIELLVDADTFIELFDGLLSHNVLDFPEYDKKLQKAMQESGEKEAVICGRARVGGFDCAIFAMESSFMMGSMGSVVGEKLSLLFEYATENRIPVIGFTVSGGARMQEGILSLMQMAKVSGSVKLHSDSGGLYIAVLTDPTTGGITASFAMEGDIIIAEPNALIGFAGPRVIEDTIRQKLPAGFQRAEFLLEKGFVDAIVPRLMQKEYLVRLLAMHAREAI